MTSRAVHVAEGRQARQAGPGKAIGSRWAVSVTEGRKLLSAKGRSKYRNVRTEIDGIVFASKKEARRWVELQALERAGEIEHLIRQPRYRILVRQLPLTGTDLVECGSYYADFQYYRGGTIVVEDIKGGSATKTPIYRLKKRIVEALYGVTITEI